MTTTDSFIDQDELVAARNRLAEAIDDLMFQDGPDWDDAYAEFTDVLRDLDEAVAMHRRGEPADQLAYLVDKFAIIGSSGDLWYSDSVFVKRADVALVSLLARQKLDPTPGWYTLESGGEIRTHEAAPPTSQSVRSFDASDSVTLEFVAVNGERPVRTLSKHTRAYLLRAPDGRAVLLDRRYVDWIEQTEPIAACTQSAQDPLGPVAFRYADGQALGFVMPIRDNRSEAG
jgi:hypothetical protein